MLIPSEFIGLVIGWVTAFFIEKRYVSRTAQLGITLSACEMVGMDVFVLEFINSLDLKQAWQVWKVNPYVKGYLCSGVLVGILGLVSYLAKNKNSKEFYKLTYWLYSSKTLMPLTTTILLFRYFKPSDLYTMPFWATCGSLALLTWLPKVAIPLFLMVAGYIYFS